MRGKQILEVAAGILAVVLVVWLVVWTMGDDDRVTSSDQGATPSATQTVEPSTSVPVSPPTTTKPKTTTAPLSLFYVAVGDDGVSGTQIGCGDSLVMKTTESVSFTNQVAVSFGRLLADHDQYLGGSGLYNALYQSDLSYVGSSVSGDTVTVNLTGTLRAGGVCDTPRIESQLERTASVAAGVGNAVVKVDGKTVEQLLSAR